MRLEDHEAIETFNDKVVPVLSDLGTFIRAHDGSPQPGSALAAEDGVWPGPTTRSPGRVGGDDLGV